MIKKIGISVILLMSLSEAGYQYENVPFTAQSNVQENTNSDNDTEVVVEDSGNPISNFFSSIGESLSNLVSKDETTDEHISATKDYSPYLDGIPLENRLIGDVDGDCKPDIVTWEEFAEDSKGSYYQLSVYGKYGTLKWQGPKERNPKNQLIFGSWDIGTSMPQVLIDLNGDCKNELIAQMPSNDISPQYFKIISWDKGCMAANEPKILMTNDLKHFKWIKSYPKNRIDGTWVMNLYPTNKAQVVKADVISMDKRGNAKMGQVLLKFNKNSVVVQKWIKKLSPLTEEMATVTK